MESHPTIEWRNVILESGAIGTHPGEELRSGAVGSNIQLAAEAE